MIAGLLVFSGVGGALWFRGTELLEIGLILRDSEDLPTGLRDALPLFGRVLQAAIGIPALIVLMVVAHEWLER